MLALKKKRATIQIEGDLRFLSVKSQVKQLLRHAEAVL